MLANVFKSGFNFHAPQFEGVPVYPYSTDNYATLINYFKVTKYFSHNTKRLSLNENVNQDNTIKLQQNFMVNEIKFSSRLNKHFKD